MWRREVAISRIKCQTPEKADTEELMEAALHEQVATSKNLLHLMLCSPRLAALVERPVAKWVRELSWQAGFF